MNRNLRAMLLAMASAGALASASAYAQDAAPQTAAPAGPAEPETTDDAATGFDDIVVTARRRDERLQDVPVAVSAISGDSLASKSIQQIQDLTRVVPGFTASQGGFGGGVPRYTIRSQVQFEQLISLDPSVGVYVADVIQARAHGTNAGFFDLNSVEVLRGPQGTLFGRNTTGGAVLINPKTPTDVLEGYFQATTGNYRTFIGEGAVNVPLAEGLALRVAGRVAKRRGYTYAPAADRYYDDENNQSWRVSLGWEPFDGFSNVVMLNGYNSNEYGTGWRLTEVFPGTPFGNRPDIVSYLASVGDRRIAGQSATTKGSKADVFGIANTTTLDLGGVTIKNIFGYRKVDSFSTHLDFDGTPIFIYEAPEDLHQKQYSNEFQVFGSAFDDRLDWIVGAYYFRETGNETQRSTIRVTNQDLVRTGFVENTSKSVFAQGTFKFTPELSLTAGGRYTWDKRTLEQYGFNFITGRCSSTIALPNCITPEREAKFKAPTYTVSLDWKVAPDKLVYLAHRRGYRSGGFNIRANNEAQIRPFDPEVVKDIEGGLKADWDLGGGALLRTNIAAYHQWYSDIQRSITFIDPVSNLLVSSVVNAATANVSGFEAEMMLRPVDGLEITGTLAHSKLRYKKFEQVLPNGSIQDLSANRIGFSPEWTGGGSIRYTHDLAGDAGSIAAQVDAYSQSKMQLQDLNVPGGIAQPYTLVNFRLEWNDLLGTRISAATFVRNAFNKEHFTGGIAIGGLGLINKNYGAPRTYGIELRIPFGG